MSISNTPASPTYEALVSQLSKRLSSMGIDIVTPLAVGAYNDAVAPELRLPDFGNAQSLAILCGNTRAFWPRFIAALRTDQALQKSTHPVDLYVERVMRAIVHEVCAPWKYELRFAHEPPPRLVAIQRLAEVAGLAALSPSHLCVHPIYGPWLSLRAVVVVQLRGPDERPAIRREPCASCPRPCMPPLQVAVAAGGATHAGLLQNWRLWLAVRDACPVGTEHRYSDSANRYFYSRDRRALDEDR